MDIQNDAKDAFSLNIFNCSGTIENFVTVRNELVTVLSSLVWFGCRTLATDAANTFHFHSDKMYKILDLHYAEGPFMVKNH